MDIFNTISANAWIIAYTFISVFIPIMIVLLIMRVIGGSAKKTVRAVRRK